MTDLRTIHGSSDGCAFIGIGNVEAIVNARITNIFPRQHDVGVVVAVSGVVERYGNAVPCIRQTMVRCVPEIDVQWRKGKPGIAAPGTIAAGCGIGHAVRIGIKYGKQSARRVKGAQEPTCVNCEQRVGKIAWCIARTPGHILWTDRESLKVW